MSTALDRPPAAQSGSTASPGADETRAPRAVLWAAGLAIGGLIAGALYLMIVRGEVMLLDLSVFKLLCL